MLTQAVGYAATALGSIATMGGKPVLVKEVAEACDIPAPYLAKIVNTLAHKGIVATQRGIGGGVTLVKDPAKVTLYDLCVALDDPVVNRRCMLGVAECSDERACPAHEFWTAHRAKLQNFLQTTTIAEIAAFETRRLWAIQSKLNAAASNLTDGPQTQQSEPAPAPPTPPPSAPITLTQPERPGMGQRPE